ncbi:MAG: YIP1 family protein [Candidatus Eisenbacteria bacterium]|uniref:YIP1 family protein n=1 Tax=Eiseniibacteriota bacterium TaxID=2212470 RepID=A0A933SAY0_UNCEI|nr:YIP1 family protein [Candidatus Eisenbacteria bacterium]
MSSTDFTTTPPSAPAGVRLSPLERARRVFVSPSTAWEGLEEQVQWWIPMVLLTLVTVGLFFLLYQRAYLPMMLDQLDQQVVNGQLPAEQVDRMEQVYSGVPAQLMIMATQVIAVVLITLLWASVTAFGIGFVLGGRLSYRLALEAVCWSSLVSIPAQILVAAMAWSQETMKGVHVGLAALLPQADTPSKLQTGLTVFLDSISPFSVWNLFVLVVACSTFSRLPRRNVAWVLVSLYLALFAIGAVLSALFAPGA